jgi:hypothetical protein
MISKRALERFNAAKVDEQYVMRFEKILNRKGFFLKTAELGRQAALLSERS